MVLEHLLTRLAAAMLVATPALALADTPACPNCPVQTALAAEDVSDEQVQKWIKQLDSNSYDEREAATRELKKTNNRAVKELSKAAAGDSAEASKRALDVLKHLYHEGDAKAKAEAGDALKKLSESDNARIARRAKAAMEDAPKKDNEAPIPAQGGGVFRIQLGGIQIGGGGGGPQNGPRIKTQENDEMKKHSIEDGKKKIEITENKKTGNITIKVTEPAEEGKKSDNGDEKKGDKKEAKPKVTEYKAKNLKELKEKHPDAAKMYEKYIEKKGDNKDEDGDENDGGNMRGVIEINGQQIPIDIPIQIPMPQK